VAEREWAATGSPRNTGADPRPVTIDEGVTTPGAVGNTLVKGVIMQLPAEAFSVKPGGVVERLIVGGNLETHGDKVTTCAVEVGKVSAIGIGGEIIANGQGSGAVRVSSGGSTPLTNVRVRAKTGRLPGRDRWGGHGQDRICHFVLGAKGIAWAGACGERGTDEPLNRSTR
jgi:hypothetical protein